MRAFFEDDGGHEQRTTWHTIMFDEERQLGVAEWFGPEFCDTLYMDWTPA